MKTLLVKTLLLLVFYVLTIVSLNAQINGQFFDEIGIKNGLSSNYPTSILQDSKGFIWVGTNDGLNRYDGYQSKVFKFDPNDNNTISDNWITTLLEDSNGDIWIGTDGGGLNHYNSTTGAITRFGYQKGDSTTINSNVILSIYEDSKLRIWVGTKHGLDLFDRSKLIFQHWEQPNPCEKCSHFVSSIVEDNEGNLWIGDRFYGLYYFNTSSYKFTKPHLKYSNKNKLTSKLINDLCYSKGKLWVATDDGLMLLDTYNETYEDIAIDNIADKHFIENVFIWKVYNDNNGGIWLCTYGSGLIHYELDKKQITRYQSNENSRYKIGSNIVEDILFDKSKNVWLASRGSGVNKFNLNNLKFKHWKSNNNNSLLNKNVRALLQDQDGTIWVGTNDGLSRYNPISNTSKNYITDFNYKDDIKNLRIRSIFKTKNKDLWIGSQSGGLYRYDKKEDRFKPAINDTNSKEATIIKQIASIYELENDKLLLGTLGKGFFVYNTITSEYKQIVPKNSADDILFDLNINCMLKASDSEIWVGSNRGLILLNINTLKFKLWDYKEGCDNCIPGNKIRSLFLDDNNKLWVGTRNGLGIFDPESEKWEQYRTNDGLPSNIIFGILPGVDGNIWLTTPNGLSRVNPANFKFENVTIPEYNILDMGGYSQGLDGNLLVGGPAGLTIFNPDDINITTHISEVVFTDIKVNGQTIKLDKNISELKAIDLLYNQNNLTFEFSALEFTNSKMNKYKYKLEGFNNKWIECGSKHDLTFTNLDPKSYVLKIKGSNNEGVWNENETSLIINIKAPWWKTPWFIALSALIVIGSIFTIYYLRITRLKKAELRLRKEVSKQTKELSKQTKELSKQTKELLKNNKELEVLHKEKDGIIGIIVHDLRGPLNNIDGLIYLLEDNGNLDEEQKMYVKYINESVSSGNSLITDLLFMSDHNDPEKNVEYESFNFLEFIEEWGKSYVSRLNKKDQKLRKYIDEKSLIINTDKKFITRIFDNLMTNAIKFSNKGSKIDIIINSNNDNIIISFKDYGPGMSETDKKTAFGMFQKLTAQPTDGESSHGLGLSIIKILVEKLEGSIKIESKLGEGTEFIISLPKQSSYFL